MQALVLKVWIKGCLYEICCFPSWYLYARIKVSSLKANADQVKSDWLSRSGAIMQ